MTMAEKIAVLVVEDEPITRMDVVEQLEEGGFKVFEAASHEQPRRIGLASPLSSLERLFRKDPATHVAGPAPVRELRSRLAQSAPNCDVVEPVHFVLRGHAGTSCRRERLAHVASRVDTCSISSSSGRQTCSLSTVAMS